MSNLIDYILDYLIVLLNLLPPSLTKHCNNQTNR